MSRGFRPSEEWLQHRLQTQLREVEPGVLGVAAVALPAPKPRKAPEYGEDAKQKALIEWAQFVTVGPWKLSDLLTAVPNGGYRTHFEAVNFKLLGVQSGYPDLLLDVPAGRYNGARWEMKHGDNKPTEKQRAWHETLRELGYYVNVCWQMQEAADDIVRYLKLQSRYTITVRARMPA